MTTPHWFRDLAIVRYDYYHNKSTKKPGPKTRVSYEEIATAFGLTKGRISQIIASFMDGKTPEHDIVSMDRLLTAMIENSPPKTGKEYTLGDLVGMVRAVEDS